jgi:VanZ family protein
MVWFALICVMSSSTFSAEHTLVVVRDLLRWIGITWSPRVLNMAIRKTAHFSIYAIFFLILTSGPFRGRPFAAILICVLTGSLDEIHQLILATRTPSVFDAGIDTAGALFGLFARLFSDNSRPPPWHPVGLVSEERTQVIRS